MGFRVGKGRTPGGSAQRSTRRERVPIGARGGRVLGFRGQGGGFRVGKDAWRSYAKVNEARARSRGGEGELGLPYPLSFLLCSSHSEFFSLFLQVAGIIETNRPDLKNALYLDTIKKGDALLNRIQKLSKVIDVE